ncbi:EB module, partial [Cooperia oncophora]
MPPAGPACTPACVGGAACYAGACQCAQPTVVYNPVVGCSPPMVAPVPVAPAPVVTGRLIPQALPGSPCEPGVECTGGSVCSLGVCLCPPELVQEGTVCVTRTVYSVAPPPPVAVPAVPVSSYFPDLL